MVGYLAIHTLIERDLYTYFYYAVFNIPVFLRQQKNYCPTDIPIEQDRAIRNIQLSTNILAEKDGITT